MKDRAIVRFRPVDTSHWPDPPMVPSVALRRIEKAQTIEEARAIARSFLRPRGER